ncbi:hypothetical protein [Actinacidiphila acidipaludis]|uniref:Uncharacterized protein n=1 Tax=Actinacidiphila acidipaludis TaxID=2873382 RepID=A0ABS7Q836_9ACTN|nr:hypothetical protein [Streptomyces acidipaludis]MBY8879308.1 hypothetical protein [Streptomyces acidipaludis]
MVSVTLPRKLADPDITTEVTPGTLPEEDVEPLFTYMESAEALIVSPGTVPDPFTGHEGWGVRIGIMTDGEWVWDLAWADYVNYHRVAPPREFIEHARSRGFEPPEIPLERLEELAVEMGIPQP